MKVVSSRQMRKLETAAAEEIGLPTLLLMENAAIRLSEHCLAYLNDGLKTVKAKPKVVIMAGVGGNGGDGLALARHLHLKGIDVNIYMAGDISGIQGDAYINLEIVRKMGLAIIPIDERTDIQTSLRSCDLAVDALFGAGLNRRIEGVYENVIEMINNYANYVISVDIPSGISADTGQVLGIAVKANVTVTMGYPKTGIMIYPGAAYAGKVEIADISLPRLPQSGDEPELSILTDSEITWYLPPRQAQSNKSSYGRVYGFAGSAEMPGAAALSATAAYKAGAGYVYACAVPSAVRVLQHSLKEAITRILPHQGGFFCKKSLDAIAEELKNADVVYIGPGIGRGAHVTEFVFALIETVQTGMVLDADALNSISEDISILKKLKRPCVITPHPGEMSRLTGLSVNEIVNNTIDTASEFSRKFNVITVLKDARTIVSSPSGNSYINVTGCSALAKAGSGDVLTGIIAGFMAQGLDPFTAAKLGVYIHGKAGQSACEQLSNYGVLATDLLNHIPIVLNHYERLKM